MTYVLEGCVDSVESALMAEKGGANRLELCGDLIIGGVTPNVHLFELVKENTNIDVNVLIRPRYGDFLYTDFEFEMMKRDIELFRQKGASGVVVGVLKEDGTLDLKRMKALVEIAGSMDITLHRAFDVCKKPLQALQMAKELGVNSILTSGQSNNCLEGKKLIKELVALSGENLNILIGGGVSSDTIDALLQYTKGTCYHMSGKRYVSSPMIYKNDQVNMGLSIMDEYTRWITDSQEINLVKNKIEHYVLNNS